MRQRIGTARTSPTMVARPRAARPAGRSASSCWCVTKTNSFHLADAFDQLRGRGIALRLGVDSGHRGLERLAVEVGHDGDAGGLGPRARSILKILPLLAHELARPCR